jgi:putative FmdB family regulatory protein
MESADDFFPGGWKTLPLYAYRCTQCGHKFEKIQNFSATPEQECPQCHGVLERPLTAPGLQFKGGGWYVNDYAPKSSSPAAETTPAPAKTEAPCGAAAGAACAACPAVAASTPG